jgi:hypothetical protein
MAGELDWESALAWVDERFEYSEPRMIAPAPKTEILYCVAFVNRGKRRRVIGLRRAGRREAKHYVENLQAFLCSHAYGRRGQSHYYGRQE